MQQWQALHLDGFPLFTDQGRWRRQAGAGFSPWWGSYPAMMWTFYEHGGGASWRESAEASCLRLETVLDAGAVGTGCAVHFGGHLRWCELARRERLPEPRVRNLLVRVGCDLAVRIKPGGYLSDGIGSDVLSLTSLLEVPSMLFAASETQDNELTDRAAGYCALIRKHLVRADGSTVEAVRMNAATGGLLKPVARFGLCGDSCWSCGLAWAILGFATVGRMMEFEPWLETARRCANYLMERLSGDPIPAWDFDAPTGSAGVQRDSAAAAVAAAALFALADAEQRVGADEARHRQRLQETALRILDALCAPEYLSVNEPAWEGILRHGVGSVPAGWAVDESLIWGDAFFVEALHRAIQFLRART